MSRAESENLSECVHFPSGLQDRHHPDLRDPPIGQRDLSQLRDDLGLWFGTCGNIFLGQAFKERNKPGARFENVGAIESREAFFRQSGARGPLAWHGGDAFPCKACEFVIGLPGTRTRNRSVSGVGKPTSQGLHRFVMQAPLRVLTPQGTVHASLPAHGSSKTLRGSSLRLSLMTNPSLC